MSKELVALERIGTIDIDGRYPYPNFLKDKIEYKEYYKTIEKALKVLDIIFTKSVSDRTNCNVYKHMESKGRYNSGLESQYRLTQEEFDLIKEFYDRYNRSDENGIR